MKNKSDLRSMRDESGHRNNMNKIALVIIAILVIVGGYLLFRGRSGVPGVSPSPTPSGEEMFSPTPSPSETPSETPSPTPSPAPTSSSAALPSSAPKPSKAPSPTPAISSVSFDVFSMDFRYNPKVIKVRGGQRVTIKFYNTGTLPHNLTIPSINLATKTVGPGHADIIEFIAPGEGEYEFFCTVDSHKNMGMTGTLKVEN